MINKRPYLILSIQLIIGFFAFANLVEEDRHIAPIPTERILEESSSMDKSNDKNWWLNSGARVYINGNILKTLQGNLVEGDYWQSKYKNYNAEETDNGFHPQNIFRLVTKGKYNDPVQSMYFKINNYILSQDIHRAASNGVLFFNRYQDGDNLYYVGLRVDGQAVIKKKTNGIYYTMAYKPVYFDTIYNRESNPNLIPANTWIGIKSEISNMDNQNVLIKLFIDRTNSGNWELITEAIDDGNKYGGKSITGSGYAGIRSDFMDVEFEEYNVIEKSEELKAQQ